MKFQMPMIPGVDNAAAEKNVQPWVWPYGLKGRQTAVAVSSLHLFKQGRLPVLLPQPAVGLVCLLELVLLPDRVQMPVSDKIPSGLVNRKRRSCFPADQIDLLHPLKVTGTGLQAAFPGHGYELEPAGFQPGIQVQFLQKRSRKNQPVLTGNRQEQIEPLSDFPRKPQWIYAASRHASPGEGSHGSGECVWWESGSAHPAAAA